MYNAILRNSGLFSPSVIDELNNAFAKTLQKIEEFKPTPLEPKRETSAIEVKQTENIYDTFQSNSFSIGGHEMWINLTINPKSDITDKVIATISPSAQFRVFASFVSDDGSAVPCMINGETIKAYGTLKANTDWHLITWYLSA